MLWRRLGDNVSVSTGFHIKLTPLPPDPPHPWRRGRLRGRSTAGRWPSPPDHSPEQHDEQPGSGTSCIGFAHHPVRDFAGQLVSPWRGSAATKRTGPVTCPMLCLSPHQPRCALWPGVLLRVASDLHSSARFGPLGPHTPPRVQLVRALPEQHDEQPGSGTSCIGFAHHPVRDFAGQLVSPWRGSAATKRTGPVTCPMLCLSPHQPRCALWPGVLLRVASDLHSSARFGPLGPHTPPVYNSVRALPEQQHDEQPGSGTSCIGFAHHPVRDFAGQLVSPWRGSCLPLVRCRGTRTRCGA